MSLDNATVEKIARLARIKLTPDETIRYKEALNGILGWVEQLNEVDTTNVQPMTSVVETSLYMRPDEITDGHCATDILANAPDPLHGFFTVPKVVE